MEKILAHGTVVIQVCCQSFCSKTHCMTDFLVIQGETGSGKSTQVPLFILFDSKRHNQYCNILVTQPRRIAAMSIARQVSERNGWKNGSLCGYQVTFSMQAV